MLLSNRMYGYQLHIHQQQQQRQQNTNSTRETSKPRNYKSDLCVINEMNRIHLKIKTLLSKRGSLEANREITFRHLIALPRSNSPQFIKVA